MPWMSHPKHGRMHSAGPEIKWNQDNGWKIDPLPKAPEPAPVEPPAPVEAVQPVVEAAPEPAPQSYQPQERKQYGRR